MDIRSAEELLQKQLGGHWHNRQKPEYVRAASPGETAATNFANPLEGTEYFVATFKEPYGLALSRTLREKGVGHIATTQGGITEMRITPADVGLLRAKTSSHHTIQAQIARDLNVTPNDKSRVF